MDIFDIVKVPFGFVLRYSYQFLGSYALALVLFALLIKVILFPISIKQQKGTVKQASLTPKVNKIKQKYAGRSDKATQEKMNAEIMELYQKEKFSPLSGCLPLLLQLPILIALFYVVTAPIKYTVPHVYESDVFFSLDQLASPGENAAFTYLNEKIIFSLDEGRYSGNDMFRFSEGELYGPDGEKLKYATDYKITVDKKITDFRKSVIEETVGLSFGRSANEGAYKEINFIQRLQSENEDDVIETDKLLQTVPGFEDLKEMNFNLFGMNLLSKPEISSPLIIIPILSFVFAFLQMRITKKLTGQQQMQTGGPSMKFMDFIMPLFSLYISFIVPAAIGIYWLLSNVFQIFQQILLSRMYPIAVAETGDSGVPVKSSKKDVIETTYTETDADGDIADTDDGDNGGGDENNEDQSDEKIKPSELPKGVKKTSYTKTGKNYSIKKKKK